MSRAIGMMVIVTVFRMITISFVIILMIIVMGLIAIIVTVFFRQVITFI
jgi:hypothetical protein